MKRIVLAVFVCVFVAARLCAASDEAGVSEGIRTAARPGLAVGLSLEIAGFLGVVASTITLAADDDAARGAAIGAFASGGAVQIGGLVQGASYTARYAAFRHVGIAPRPNRLALSWLFSAATSAMYAIAVVAWARGVDGEEDSWGRVGAASVSMGAFGTSLALEVVNALVFRLLLRRDLDRATSATAPTAALAPFVASRDSRRPRPAVGLLLRAVF